MIRSLYIVIVNWNLKEDTLACISSLLEAGIQLEKIIIVDNGSSDGSVGAFRKIYGKNIGLIHSEINLGFAGGNNLGIKQSMAHDAEWIFLLNNDTLVAPTFLIEFTKAIEEYPEYSIFSPLIMDFYAKDKIWSSGNRLIPGTLVTYALHKNKIDSGQLPAIIPVDFITGCGMLIKVEVFKIIGLLNPKYFMYSEDVEFCLRAKKKGYKIACVTKAKIWHKVSTSANKDKITQRYLRVRNQVSVYRQFSKNLQKPVMFLFSFVKLFFDSIIAIFHEQSELIKPMIIGYYDGWFRPNDMNGPSHNENRFL